MPPTFADVIFPQRLSQPFTYSVPTSWNDALKVGHWVLAPFGRSARPGFVIAISEKPANTTLPKDRIRQLEEHLTVGCNFELDPTLVALAEWMADYYISPLGVCFQLIQPPRPPFTTSSRLRITSLGKQALERSRLSDLSKALLDTLDQSPKGLTLATLKKVDDTASKTVTQLKRQKWIEEVYTYTLPSAIADEKKLSKDKAKSTITIDSHPKSDLSTDPPWWKNFQERLVQKSFGEFFTDEIGTRLSELIIRAIRETLSQKQTALILLPDIHQVSCWANDLRTGLGVQVGLFHSGLSETVRVKEWQAINQGQYQIVVGTRSSVFAPIPSLGFLCLIHEEDSSYKEEQGPYYHAREVARERARQTRSTFLLHSPHPSLETAHYFSMTSKEKNAFSVKPPKEGNSIQVVDHLTIPYGTTISQEMRQGIESALLAGGGIVIFHNRKGFSSSIACRDCGISAQCESCQVPYKLLTQPPLMRCPYCGKVEPVPVICPACSGSHLEPTGFGTERLAQEIHREFPDAKIERFDRNNVRTDLAAQNIRELFCKGKIQILVGTEMLFHATPPAPVRFVGIPFADAGLHLPDFRSAERLYFHLQSAVNLLTRETDPGQVVIQTRLPSHHVMQAVAQQQQILFYEHELAFRQAIGYPPFIHFIQMTVSGNNQSMVQEAARQWVQSLAGQIAHHSAKRPTPLAGESTILGPLASHTFKHRRLFREHILFKATDFPQARAVIHRTYETMMTNKTYKGVQFGINVDPTEML